MGGVCSTHLEIYAYKNCIVEARENSLLWEVIVDVVNGLIF
jgi:hypothetical protein